MTARWSPLPAGPFDLIYCDPPWRFGGWADNPDSPSLRNPIRHYPCMETADIAALPVGRIAAADSVLMMWATMPKLDEAFGLMEAWGFRYATCALTWVKVNENGAPFMGLGYYTRQNAELCLLGRRGKGLPVKAHDVPSVILSRRREHSRKPDGAYDLIERLFGRDVRRIELFARQAWPGWSRWGFDSPEYERPGLLNLAEDVRPQPQPKMLSLLSLSQTRREEPQPCPEPTEPLPLT